MKKLALFVGNCQAIGIMKFLVTHKQFNDEFDCKFYANWQMIENNDLLPTKELRNCDLFIYQPLRKIHNCFSTDPSVDGSIGSLVKDSAIKLSFPYIYNNALWPIFETHTDQQKHDRQIFGWRGNKEIDSLISEGYSCDDIIKLYLDRKLDFNFSIRMNHTMTLLELKESMTDLKIVDFINNNLCKKRLFLTHQHPTSHIFVKLCNDILLKLGFDTFLSADSYDLNHAVLPDSVYKTHNDRLPISYYDKNFFNLEFEEIDPMADDFYCNVIKRYFSIYG